MIELDEAVIRLLAAAGLSGVIGFEREVAQKAAGMRTHMLVGLGSGLFTLLGLVGFIGSDPARVAAQVVAGVGFLGAGAIFRSGLTVRGLTTAAGLWTAAAVGMAAGLGEYAVALVGTGVAVVVLYVVGWVQWLFRGKQEPATVTLEVRLHDPSQVVAASAAARTLVQPLGSVSVQEIGSSKSVLRVRVAPRQCENLMVKLHALPEVDRVTRLE
ncbi:MAG TPA: MgtC/SapB family protein [Acidimicrobiia bacterium]|nr:MgtC/SapB family protein [Acidimicrobiia bacterium]